MMPNPWLIVALLLALAGSHAAVAVWSGNNATAIERAAWQGKENAELKMAAAQIKELEDEARRVEQAHAQKLERIATNYERKLRDAKTQRDSDMAAAHAGDLRLFVACAVRADHNQAGTTATGPGLGDGAAGCELPRTVVANLFALANDADALAGQLESCQAVIRADREGAQ